MRRYDLPFEVVEAAELEEVKGALIQVLQSLNQKEIAADLVRGSTTDLFYKVMLLIVKLSGDSLYNSLTGRVSESLAWVLLTVLLLA